MKRNRSTEGSDDVQPPQRSQRTSGILDGGLKPVISSAPSQMEILEKFCGRIRTWADDTAENVPQRMDERDLSVLEETTGESTQPSCCCGRRGASECAVFSPLPSIPTIVSFARDYRVRGRHTSTHNNTEHVLSAAVAAAELSAVERVAHSHFERTAGVTGIVYDERMLLHVSKDPHDYERPGRLQRSMAHLRAVGLLDRCQRLPCAQAKTQELRAVHTNEHIDRIDQFDFLVSLKTAEREDHEKQRRIQLGIIAPDNQEGMDSNPNTGLRCTEKNSEINSLSVGQDLYASAGTARAARLAAGGVVQAARSVCSGEVRNAFALVRPPGHHCSATRPSGFCYFNNVAVGVRAAQKMLQQQWSRQHAQQEGEQNRQQVKRAVRTPRVMIVDWDVHHCDGTEAIFYDDPTVLVLSIHQHKSGRGHVLRKLPTDRTDVDRRDENLRDGGDGGGEAQHNVDVKDGASNRNEISADDLALLLDNIDGDAESPSLEKHERNPSEEKNGKKDVKGEEEEEEVEAEAEQEEEEEETTGRRPRKKVDYAKLAAELDAADDDAAAAMFGVKLDEVDSSSSSNTSNSSGSDSVTSSHSKNGSDTAADQRGAPFHHPGDTEGLSWDADSLRSVCSPVKEQPVVIGRVDSDDEQADFFYPGTGHMDRVGGSSSTAEGKRETGEAAASRTSAKGKNINIPWPTHGFGDLEYLTLFQEIVVPVAHEFQPDIVFVSSGFDSADGDLLGSMKLTPSGYYTMTKIVASLSPRLVVVLEGGYNLSNVARCSEAVLRGLLESNGAPAGNPPLPRSRMLLSQCEQLIQQVKQTHHEYWPQAFQR